MKDGESISQFLSFMKSMQEKILDEVISISMHSRGSVSREAAMALCPEERAKYIKIIEEDIKRRNRN